MEVSGQLRFIPRERAAGWPRRFVREKFVAPTGSRTPNLPARNLITTPTELLRLLTSQPAV
jgi:hypothetical protein